MPQNCMTVREAAICTCVQVHYVDEAVSRTNVAKPCWLTCLLNRNT